MIEEKYQKEFAYLKDTAYLDAASVGLQPERTLVHCRQFQQEFVDSFGRICFGPYGEMRRTVARNLALLIGADVPEKDEEGEILFTANTTEGDSLLSDSLLLEAGDSVISSSYEYPSVVLGWAMRQKEGIRLKLVKSVNGRLDADAVIEQMDVSTRVVELSFVQYHSGFRADLKKIGRECRRRGILFCVDAIQGLGRNPLDVKEMCIDVLSCGAFKGLLGPFGTGFVYVRREVIPLLTPRWYSDSNLQVNEEDLPGMETLPVFSHREGILRLSGGSRNTYGITSMGKSVELLLEIGIDRIHEQVMGLERYFRNRIREEELPLSFLGSEQEEHWSGNICMEFASEKTQQLMEELEKRKIYARVSEGYLRLGLHYYNTQEHLERAVEALQRIFQTVPCR